MGRTLPRYGRLHCHFIISVVSTIPVNRPISVAVTGTGTSSVFGTLFCHQIAIPFGGIRLAGGESGITRPEIGGRLPSFLGARPVRAEDFSSERLDSLRKSEFL
jgi:hypothetical protein